MKRGAYCQSSIPNSKLHVEANGLVAIELESGPMFITFSFQINAMEIVPVSAGRISTERNRSGQRDTCKRKTPPKNPRKLSRRTVTAAKAMVRRKGNRHPSSADLWKSEKA